MNLKFKFVAMFILVSFLLSVPLTSAFFPQTHAYLIKEVCSQGYNTDMARMCCNDMDACIAGDVLSDLSVVYYLEQGFRKYTVTHSDIYCRNAIAEARNPTEEALAAGICLHHTGADRVAHNVYVPSAIRNTALPNVLIHPFAEQKMDNYVKKLDPNIKDTLDDAMRDSLDYVDFIQRVLQPNPEYGDVDVRKLTVGFIQQVKESETGYDVSFATVKAIPNYIFIIVGLMFFLSILGLWFIIKKTNKTFSTVLTMILLSIFIIIIIVAVISLLFGSTWAIFTSIASPISALIPTANDGVVMNQAYLLTENALKFGVDYPLTLPPELNDITGLRPGVGGIALAEQQTKGYRWIYLVVIILFILTLGFFNYKNRKKNKWKKRKKHFG